MHTRATMAVLQRFSFGVGDRFGRQAKAQLAAFQALAKDGVDVTPVWNKSNREHTLIGSTPESVLEAARAAVRETGWDGPWHVDADHIRLETVEPFIPCSDFFTIDVAESIGAEAPADEVSAFLKRHPELDGEIPIAGLTSPIRVDQESVRRIAGKYLLAAREAGRIHRHIADRKRDFIAEVSMDETDSPQTPVELLVILAALADEGVRAQTIAPRFTGRFNKGVDYVGDVEQFEREFQDDIAVIAHAVRAYDLPSNLKLSVHSGSDKFSLYPVIRRVLQRTNAGLHLKTAGTTWLEELIGLAESGGAGLVLVKEIYASAVAHAESLCAPYATVIQIDFAKLPAPAQVSSWTGAQFANALRHDPAHPEFNPHFRQLLHVSFKLAAQQGLTYLTLLHSNEEIVSRNVTANLYNRHLRPLFVG